MASAFRSLTRFTLASVLLATLVATACTNQQEGERCDRAKTGNADCEPPLVCIPAEQLSPSTADRCCPAMAGEESDARCTRKSSSGGGGSSGDGGADSAAGSGGVPSEGGAAGASAGAPSDGGVPASGGVPAGGGAPASGGVPASGEAGMSSLAGQGGAP